MAEKITTAIAKYRIPAKHQIPLQEIYRTNNIIGKGAFAEVVELEYHGLLCAGKKLKSDVAQWRSVSKILHRFHDEIKLLRRLSHPCIVQCLGLWFEPESDIPVMVMEYLHTSLSNLLEKHDDSPIPENISYGILRDVALGLRFLHERPEPIGHRDLTANNVLLTTNMNAKIADLGLAKILKIHSIEAQNTMSIGTPCYMPPEMITPLYDVTKVDIFSYGILILHTLTRKWPHPEPHYNPEKKRFLTEFERRESLLQEVDSDHLLTELIRACLEMQPEERPAAADAFEKIDQCCKGIHSPYNETRLEIFEQLEALRQDKRQQQHTRVQAQICKAADEGQLFQPQAKLHWKRCANMPAAMEKPQAVVIREKVYIGGGITDKCDLELVFQYDLSRNEWSHLSRHRVSYFAMAHFNENLITVGGIMNGSITNKVYRYREESHEWEMFPGVKPMPTARLGLSVATTQSAIVASGGVTGIIDGKYVSCAEVEVYSSETSQWYTADPLRVPCYFMSSSTIADTYYLLGGIGNHQKAITIVMYTSLSSLIQKATQESASHKSTWKTLPVLPHTGSAAANLCGSLIAVGGRVITTISDLKPPTSPKVHIFLPLSDGWIKVIAGDLPEPRYASTAMHLPSNEILVIGGKDKRNKRTKTIFRGSITG